MSQIFHNQASTKEIITVLDRELHGKKWIGDLNLTEQDFKTLTNVVRSHSFDSVPLLIRIAAMVFTVRYAEFSDDETPNFWAKYARMVWHQNVDQMFQNREREKFRQTRDILMSDYGFYFPVQSDTKQDVVSGIYLHAILPRYLQDDFAHWLTKLLKTESDWQRAADSSIEDIIAYLKDHSTLSAVRRRLRHFVEHDVSAPTAARLVQTLAIAGQEFLSGEDAHQVAQMLSPIERDLWYELERELIPLRGQYQRGAFGKRRERRINQRWAWNLADDKLSVVIKNWRAKSTQAPDRMVWAENTEGLAQYEHFTNLTPWEQDNDTWEVDSAYLNVELPRGVIALVDAHDTVIGEPIVLSPLPHDALLFFRLDSSGEYGILTPSNQVSDGQYVICSKYPIEVIQAHTHASCRPQGRLTPLEAFEFIGHQHVERYTLTLPVDIVSNGYKQYLRNTRGVFTAQLEGHAVEGLSSQAIPIFYHQPRLRLINAAASLDDVRQLRVRVTSQSGTSRDLPLNVAVKPDGNDALVDLRGLTDGGVGIYELQLLRNFASALPERLTFALLPKDIRITSPDRNTAYTIDNPPSVIVQGIAAEQVHVLPNDGTVSQADQSVRVTWHNPHTMPHMILTVDGADIPFQWDITWYHAWVDPSFPLQTLEDMTETWLHLRGGRHEMFTLHVGDNVRAVKLRANGCYDVRIERDALYDMLRQSRNAQVAIFASCSTLTWKLFEFQRAIQDAAYNSELVQIAIATSRQIHHARQNFNQPIRSELLALPRQYINRLAASVNSTLSGMSAIHAGKACPPQTMCPSMHVKLMIDDAHALRATLEHSPIINNDVRGYLRLNDPHETKIEFYAQTIENERYQLRIIPNKPTLMHCEICNEVFLEDNFSHIKHSHGRGWKVKHNNISAESPLIVTVVLDSVELTKSHLNFLDFFDRNRMHRLQIGREHFTHQDVLPIEMLLSPSHYLHASAQWTNTLKKSPTLLNGLVNPDKERFKHLLHLTSDVLNQLAIESQKNTHPSLSALYPLFHTLVPDAQSIKNNRWLTLDTYLMTIAILYRGAAYNVSVLADLLTDQTLRHTHTFLQDALSVCPLLVDWAFTWVEFYFCYFDLPIAIKDSP